MRVLTCRECACARAVRVRVLLVALYAHLAVLLRHPPDHSSQDPKLKLQFSLKGKGKCLGLTADFSFTRSATSPGDQVLDNFESTGPPVDAGWEYTGTLLATHEWVASTSDCELKCNEYNALAASGAPQCRYWTFDTYSCIATCNQHCWLFADPGERRPAENRASGQVFPPPRNNGYQLGVDYAGNDITYQPDVGSIEQCLAVCTSTAGCTHVTYDTCARNCWLKTGMGQPTMSTCMISAPLHPARKRATETRSLFDPTGLYWLSGAWSERVTHNDAARLAVADVFPLEHADLAANANSSACGELFVWTSFDNLRAAPAAYRLKWTCLAANAWSEPRYVVADAASPFVSAPQEQPSLGVPRAGADFVLVFTALPANASALVGWDRIRTQLAYATFAAGAWSPVQAVFAAAPGSASATSGTRDSEPVLSADGSVLAFYRVFNASAEVIGQGQALMLTRASPTGVATAPLAWSEPEVVLADGLALRGTPYVAAQAGSVIVSYYLDGVGVNYACSSSAASGWSQGAATQTNCTDHAVVALAASASFVFVCTYNRTAVIAVLDSASCAVTADFTAVNLTHAPTPWTLEAVAPQPGGAGGSAMAMLTFEVADSSAYMFVFADGSVSAETIDEPPASPVLRVLHSTHYASLSLGALTVRRAAFWQPYNNATTPANGVELDVAGVSLKGAFAPTLAVRYNATTDAIAMTIDASKLAALLAATPEAEAESVAIQVACGGNLTAAPLWLNAAVFAGLGSQTMLWSDVTAVTGCTAGLMRAVLTAGATSFESPVSFPAVVEALHAPRVTGRSDGLIDVSATFTITGHAHGTVNASLYLKTLVPGAEQVLLASAWLVLQGSAATVTFEGLSIASYTNLTNFIVRLQELDLNAVASAGPEFDFVLSQWARVISSTDRLVSVSLRYANAGWRPAMRMMALARLVNLTSESVYDVESASSFSLCWITCASLTCAAMYLPVQPKATSEMVVNLYGVAPGPYRLDVSLNDDGFYSDASPQSNLYSVTLLVVHQPLLEIAQELQYDPITSTLQVIVINHQELTITELFLHSFVLPPNDTTDGGSPDTSHAPMASLAPESGASPLALQQLTSRLATMVRPLSCVNFVFRVPDAQRAMIVLASDQDINTTLDGAADNLAAVHSLVPASLGAPSAASGCPYEYLVNNVEPTPKAGGDSSGPTRAVVIAVTIVGGVVALLLIGGAIYLVRRRLADRAPRDDLGYARFNDL